MNLPRLCFLSYRAIREFARPVLAEYADRAAIEVVDGSFERTLAIARDRLERRSVDVFVSAGSNASLLRRHLQAPVATIQLTGFDILQALLVARARTARVGIVTYGQTIPELDAVKALLNIEIQQHDYTTPSEARERIAALRAAGITVVVGSSLVVELAAEAGLQGILAYSLASIRQGFDDALELARVARLEAGRYEQLDAVLHHLHDAVLAVDARGQVIAANPAMQRALSLSPPCVGRSLADLPAELGLQAVLQGRAPDGDPVLRLAGRDWIAQRRAIVEHDTLTGAMLTLYDAGAIHEADNRLRIQQRIRQTRKQPHGSHVARYRFEDLLGRSAGFVRTLQVARRYARTELAILITGESGTGKELLAQAIHQASARAARPFVAINCAAFPEGLLESELFGHEEGAFTGARRGGQRGLFEAAHTGTLFLDEIGDMPLALQTRLLRVLQEGEIQRLGAAAGIPVDVRVIAATHQPLVEMVGERRFRQDLFYRLDALRLQLPPLRARREDIALLAETLLQEALQRHGGLLSARALLVPLLPHLQRHTWPGNVRELGHTMERLAVFALQATRVDDLDWLAFAEECPEALATLLHATTDGAGRPVPVGARGERARRAIEREGGSATKAAQRLGISRTTLWRWLQQPA
ncbi:MAG TPA: propionate catabolism operon regulatory protein PrpR [Burkholderiaceae bacterium]|nr:propionate catabolism operon regulatory protein PrpR [Burkholderiaceae bacterium]